MLITGQDGTEKSSFLHQTFVNTLVAGKCLIRTATSPVSQYFRITLQLHNSPGD